MERPIFAGLLLFQSFLAALGQLINIGSSAAPFIGSLGFFTAMCLDTTLAYMHHTPPFNDDRELPLWAYPVAMFLPLCCGVQLLAATLVVFVPLVSFKTSRPRLTLIIVCSQTGRMGGDAPAEFIIASTVTVIGALCISFVLALAHRFGPRILRRAVIFTFLGLGVAMAFFYAQDTFDRTHQKRLFVVHKEDVSVELVDSIIFDCAARTILRGFTNWAWQFVWWPKHLQRSLIWFRYQSYYELLLMLW